MRWIFIMALGSLGGAMNTSDELLNLTDGNCTKDAVPACQNCESCEEVFSCHAGVGCLSEEDIFQLECRFTEERGLRFSNWSRRA
eukprot:Skav216434  [mRNA]  locus=scaffold3139:485012:485266:- [translate_table: standard]